uniref:GLNA2 n=1 Tax=Arundo donax TaxID=35708 RepID=A0A0A9DAS4_ARUDO
MLAVSCNPVNLLSFPSPYALICKSWRRERFRIAFLITSNPPSSRMLFVLHSQGIQIVCQSQTKFAKYIQIYREKLQNKVSD